MRMMKYVVVEALLKGLGIEDKSPELEKIAKICGYPPSLPVREIPVENFEKLLEWLAAYFYPELPKSEGLFKVGSKLFEGYRKTILGRVQLAALNLMGPERVVKLFPDYSGKNTNFGKRWWEQRGPQSYVICYRNVPLPAEYILGLLYGSLVEVGIKNAVLDFKKIGPEDTDFMVSW